MAIISLNDKYVNDWDSKHKTTGREVLYRTSAKLTATTYTPKITGHYHYFTDGSTGGFGAFWTFLLFLTPFGNGQIYLSPPLVKPDFSPES